MVNLIILFSINKIKTFTNYIFGFKTKNIKALMASKIKIVTKVNYIILVRYYFIF